MFEHRKETLGHGVVPAVPFPTHALAHLRRREGGTVLRTRALTATVRVLHQAAAGWRRAMACCRARSGSAVAIDALVARPTTIRVARSASTARYSQPLRVGMYVMSPPTCDSGPGDP